MAVIKTLIGEMLDRARGESSAYNYGNLTSRNNFYYTSGPTNSNKILPVPSSGNMQAPVYDKCVQVWLLNTTDTLSKASRRLPLLATDFSIDNSKIVGRAGAKLSTTDVKEGVVDVAQDTIMGNPKAMGGRWKFDYDKANGTFNKVCFGANPLYNRFDGFAVCRDIGIATDATNFQGGYYGYYIRPGVPGITGDKEILFGESLTENDTVYARYRINLESGVTTALLPTDPLYNLKLGKCQTPQIYTGGFLYVFDYVNSQVRKINPSTLVEVTYSLNSTYMSSNSFFLYNGYFYLYYNGTCYAYDGTFAQVTAQNFSYTTMGLPSEFTYQTLKIGNCGNNFIVVSTAVNGATECTNIKAVNTSQVDTMPGIISPVCYMITMTISGETRAFKVSMLREFNNDGGTMYKNGATTYRDDFQKSMKISIEWWGNILSYVELDTPITKDNTMVKYVSYALDVTA